jgi:hypothetical protein
MKQARKIRKKSHTVCATMKNNSKLVSVYSSILCLDWWLQFRESRADEFQSDAVFLAGQFLSLCLKFAQGVVEKEAGGQARGEGLCLLKREQGSSFGLG